MKRRVTDWEPGDTMRVTAPIRCASKPSWPLAPGTLVTLGRYQRFQDGVECWTVWQGATMWGAAHTQLEQAYGPVLWVSPVLGSL